MYRYVVLIWDPANDGARAAAQDLLDRLPAPPGAWTRVLLTRSFAVLHSDAAPGQGSCTTQALDAERGAICGRLLRRGHEFESPQKQMPDVDETAAVLASGGRLLLEEFWGRYVAVLHDTDAGEIHVLRDPTGIMPCYIARLAGVHIVFSDLESVLATGRLSWKMNDRFHESAAHRHRVDA